MPKIENANFVFAFKFVFKLIGKSQKKTTYLQAGFEKCPFEKTTPLNGAEN